MGIEQKVLLIVSAKLGMVSRGRNREVSPAHHAPVYIHEYRTHVKRYNRGNTWEPNWEITDSQTHMTT